MVWVHIKVKLNYLAGAPSAARAGRTAEAGTEGELGSANMWKLQHFMHVPLQDKAEIRNWGI